MAAIILKSTAEVDILTQVVPLPTEGLRIMACRVYLSSFVYLVTNSTHISSWDRISCEIYTFDAQLPRLGLQIWYRFGLQIWSITNLSQNHYTHLICNTF